MVPPGTNPAKSSMKKTLPSLFSPSVEKIANSVPSKYASKVPDDSPAVPVATASNFSALYFRSSVRSKFSVTNAPSSFFSVEEPANLPVKVTPPLRIASIPLKKAASAT